MQNLRYLLLQIRDSDDPIRRQEIVCFARALGCEPEAIDPLDLLSGFPTQEQIQQVDAVLVGGSGNYSAAGESPWLESTLAGFRWLVEQRKPTFASCWGFQAIARALGGSCIHDPPRAELGTLEFQLTEAGRRDPLFGELEDSFFGMAGHEDHVVALPPDAILLASSQLVRHQAFKVVDSPVYCTQFHPELDLQTFLDRVAAYPQYVEQIAGTTLEEFAQGCRDTPNTRQLLRRFARLVAAKHLPE